MMRVSVHGMGYVGCVTAASLARLGHEVVGVDLNASKVTAINEGRSPLGELGLAAMIREVRDARRLRATTSVAEAVASSDIALLCVGTPTAPKGGPELSALERVGEEIGRALVGRTTPYVVVLRSTVLPGTTEGVLAAALARGGASCEIRLADNPEFMREGVALRDFMSPPFTVLGVRDDATEAMLRELYAGVDAPVVKTTIAVAEAVKLVCNAFHALKVAFTNEIAAVCGALGADADEVMRVVRLDRKLNVSEAYLRPGYAFGGSCLPKDVRAINHAAHANAIEVPLLGSIMASNERQKVRGVEAVLAAGHRNVGLVGLAFKPDSDDLRESPLVSLVQALIAHGCHLKIFDPVVSSAQLVGVNRRWQEEHLPDMRSMLCKTRGELVAHADVLVIAHSGEDAEQVIRDAKPGCAIVDLTHGTPEPHVTAGQRRRRRA